MSVSFSWEKRFFQRGYQKIAGLDEAGRGALAGPIVAAGVIFGHLRSGQRKILAEVNDSKKLTVFKRERLFLLIKKNCQSWAIAQINSKVIDRIGIEIANRLVFEQVIKKIKPEIALIDGRIKLGNKNKIKYQSIIKGDQKIFSIAAASILAKVSRDYLMMKIDKKYPDYGFKQHKGYGTVNHYLSLKKHQPCPCHRLSFRLK